MPSTPVAYNTGSTISNTLQIGSLAIATGTTLGGGVVWWMGPDEDLGYVVAVPVSGGTQPTPTGSNAFVGFWRSVVKTDSSFISLAEFLSNYTQTFSNATDAKTWINNQGYWTAYVPQAELGEIYAGMFYNAYAILNNVSYSWGSNDFGVLGINSITSICTPVAICGGITFTSIGPGRTHACGLTSAGIAYCWGDSAFGALGNNNDLTDYSTPVAVCQSTLTFCQICAVGAADSQTTFALTSTGLAYSWGYNGAGELGNNTAGVGTSVSTPVAVCQGAVTYASIGGCRRTGFGLAPTGQLYSWGLSENGTLGNNTTSQVSTPVAVCGGLTFCKVDGGFNHVTAITNTGTIYAWGTNGQGELGDNTIVSKLTPIAVCIPEGTTFCQVSNGTNWSAALDSTGKFWGWGGNAWGQLGDGTQTSRRTPVSASQGTLTFCKIATGAVSSYAIDHLGDYYAWGYGVPGSLAQNSTQNFCTPVLITYL